jgi:hypothetical protein
LLARCAPLFATVALLLAVAGPAHAAFPGLNGKLAFYDSGLYTINPDGTGRVALPLSTGFAPSWSPDGAKIASEDSAGGVQVANADGSGAQNVYDTGGVIEAIDWSPDGKQIVLWDHTIESGGGDSASLIIIDVETQAGDFLVDPGVVIAEGLSWSPHGDRIAFYGFFSGNAGIHTIRPDGTGLDQVTDENAWDPDYSPSAAKLAATRWDGSQTDVVVMNPDGSGETQLTESAADDEEAAWSPNGARIAFHSDRAPDGLYTMGANGSSEAFLTESQTGPDWQPIPYTGYPRPKAAFPVEASLVPAYGQCLTPNRNHGPPLGFPSCNPPVQTSSWLTVGTADSNGLPIRSIGKVKYQVLTGNPSTPADEADVRITFNMTDVRNRADLSDYAGEVQIGPSLVRITDRFNAIAFGGGTDPATVMDIPMPPTGTCAATADPGVGGTCSLSSTLDAFVPGMVTEGKRAIWEFGPIEVWDGGEDGVVATTPNTLFARQGVFVP